ncbi:MAG: thioredoxin domain-containing protein, partial [Nitrospirae bacterium]
IAYTEAFQVTKNRLYKKVVEETFDYVKRELTSPEGAFYCGEDADSEGEEGKFYLWREDEIRELIGGDADLFIKVFNVERDGNFLDEATHKRRGTNILYMRKTLSELSNELNMDEAKLQRYIEKCREKLFKYRDKRIKPSKDDKVLTDWNGLMIASLAIAGRVFNEEKYSKDAKRAADFIIEHMRDKDGRLLHRYRDGEAKIKANIDDYAFFVWGLIEIYESTFELKYLRYAIDINNALIKHFWDDKSGGFYFTPDDGEELIVRKKEVYDGAIPSGNSVAMLNLLRLSKMTNNIKLEEMALSIGRAFSGVVKKTPSAFSQLMIAVDFSIGPSYEVVVVGEPDKMDTLEMIKNLRDVFIPNKVVLFRPIDSKDITEIAPFTKYQHSIDGKATAYVCRNYTCKEPTTDVTVMLKLLQH